MSTDCTEVSGPNGTATVATIQDTPLTPRRITVSVRRERSVIPAAVFVRSKGRGDVRIGGADVYQGNYADAVAYARHLVGSPVTDEVAADAVE